MEFFLIPMTCETDEFKEGQRGKCAWQGEIARNFLQPKKY